MLKVKVQVPASRDRAGFVQLLDGSKVLVEGVAAASSQFAAEEGGANHDHPPIGRYELTARAPTPGGAETEYGPQVFLFEPVAGPALEAESLGRFSVLLYAGSTGSDWFLRRTQGGVRLSRRVMEVLTSRVRSDADVEIELEIETLEPPRWWAFWRKRRTPPSLSRDPPRLTAPPYDEATIAARMLQSAIRRQRTRREDRDRDSRRDSDRGSDRDASSSTSRDASEFRGGGGTGGGGGASGGWTDAPAAGRGPGVNAAGVIAGAAGIAAIAAAAAAERESRSDPPGSAETTEDSGSGTADSGSPAATTNTAY